MSRQVNKSIPFSLDETGRARPYNKGWGVYEDWFAMSFVFNPPVGQPLFLESKRDFRGILGQMQQVLEAPLALCCRP